MNKFEEKHLSYLNGVEEGKKRQLREDTIKLKELRKNLLDASWSWFNKFIISKVDTPSMQELYLAEMNKIK